MKLVLPPRLDRLRARARTDLEHRLPTRPLQVSFPSRTMARGTAKRAGLPTLTLRLHEISETCLEKPV